MQSCAHGINSVYLSSQFTFRIHGDQIKNKRRRDTSAAKKLSKKGSVEVNDQGGCSS